MKTIYENEDQCIKISVGMFYDAESAVGVQYNSYQAFIPVENLPEPRTMFVSKFGVHGGIYDFNNTINQISHFLSFEKDMAKSEYQPILAEIRAAMKAAQEKPATAIRERYSVKCSTCGATIGGDEACQIDMRNSRFCCMTCVLMPWKAGNNFSGEDEGIHDAHDPLR